MSYFQLSQTKQPLQKLIKACSSRRWIRTNNILLTISSQQQNFSTSNTNPSSPPPKNIEDDGYGHLDEKQSTQTFFTSVLNHFQQRKQPGTLILIRHGETEWNHRELFTGWVDVDLSERGIREVEHAARLLLERGYTVDITYTSMLKRAIRSSWIILNEINQIYRPIIKTWRLNERMYGALEGHSKPGLAKLFGEEIVQNWRAGLRERPPPMNSNHVYWHGREKKYAHLPSYIIPRTESLQDSIDRVVPFWDSHILPDLKAGRNVLIVAHRNSIRGIIRHIEGISSPDAVQKIAIPNGIPLVYKFENNMKPMPHRNSQPPLSGIWLEKKGLLKAALEQEEELAKHVAGYAAMKDNMKGFYNTKTSIKYGGGIADSQHRFIQDQSKEKASTKAHTVGNKAELANKRVPHHNHHRNNDSHHHDPKRGGSTLHPLSIEEEETFHHHLSYYEYRPANKSHELKKPKEQVKTHSWLEYVHEDDHHSFLTNLPTSPNASAQANLLKSLAKLENERKLLKLVDENTKSGNPVTDASSSSSLGSSSTSQISSIYNSYDDASCADIFIDQEVLSHSALTQTVRLNYISSLTGAMSSSESLSSESILSNGGNSTTTFSSSFSSSTITATAEGATPNMFKTSLGLELDLNKLNQIHFFADTKHDLEELEQVLGVCFLRDKLTGKPLFQQDTTQIKELLAQQQQTILLEKQSFEEKKHPILQQPLLVIIRHGKTEHNQLGLFTGWEDAALAEEGREEAMNAGRVLRAHGVEFDVVYTSWLSRAIETAWLLLNELDSLWLPIVKTWRLNERMYGALTGLSKKMIRQIYGDEQFMKWRRGYDTPPPPISPFSHAYPGNDTRYVNYVKDVPISWFGSVIRSLAHRRLEIHRKFPSAESLKDCMERTIPYFKNVIVPDSLKLNKNVLIASSENAIRGLLMHLCDIPHDKIPLVEIPTGLPLVYDPNGRCIRLLEDGINTANPLEKYNFGSAPELVFKFKNSSKTISEMNEDEKRQLREEIVIRIPH